MTFRYNISVATAHKIQPEDGPKAGSQSVNPKPGASLAILAGFLLWLSSPPVGLWPLAWIALAPLMVSVARSKGIAQAARRGYLFGWCFLGPLWYWTGWTIVGWTGSPIGWLAWFGLTLVLALFYAAWAAAAWKISRIQNPVLKVVGWASAWVVMEWARTLGSLSMPWEQLSYTQYHFLPVLQIADMTGAYGVSFLLALVGGAIAYRVLNPAKSDRSRPLWFAGVASVMVCLYGLARMQQKDIGPTMVVADMQTGVSSFNVPSPDAQYALYAGLTKSASAAAPAPDLYVWPETGLPNDAIHNPRAYEFLQALANKYNAAIVTGSRIDGSTGTSETNSSVMFLPGNLKPERYDKQRLVPFGEFIPFRGLLDPIVGRAFQFPPDDVSVGPHDAPMAAETPKVGHFSIGTFICYESMYPMDVRAMTKSGADLLVTQSNDSWFRSTAARQQHIAAVTLRAIENRREVVRSTTTGITCVFDAEGRMLSRLPDDEPGYIDIVVHRMRGTTFYVRFGDWFVVVCMLFLARLAWLSRRPNRLETVAE